MWKTALVYGLLLGTIGVVGYLTSATGSVTALIPLFFAVPVVIAALFARNERFRKHAMHAVVLLALLAFLGSAPGLLKLEQVLTGVAERPKAVVAQAATAVMSLIFIVLAVRSFVEARRKR